MNEAAQKPREGSQQFPLTDAIQQEAKAYQYRRAPVLPFWPVWGWEKKQTFKVPCPSHLNTASGQSWGWFTAVTRGAVLSWHSYIVLQHNANPLLKVTVEGRTISFLNLLLYANWHILSICNSIMPMKKNLGRKKKCPHEFFV